MLNVCVKVLTLNRPTNITIPISKGLIYMLVYYKKLAMSKPIVTILENKIIIKEKKLLLYIKDKKITIFFLTLS